MPTIIEWLILGWVAGIYQVHALCIEELAVGLKVIFCLQRAHVERGETAVGCRAGGLPGRHVECDRLHHQFPVCGYGRPENRLLLSGILSTLSPIFLSCVYSLCFLSLLGATTVGLGTFCLRVGCKVISASSLRLKGA